MTRLVQGVGINDASYSVRPKSSRNDPCPFYMRWSDMLKRCYSEKFIKTRPTYDNCIVCHDWIYFSNFKAWMEKQDWEGNELDKDILVPENKVYSPETCLFVPPPVNNFFKGLKTNAVYYDNDRAKFRVAVNNKFIGRYDTEDEALESYSLHKLKEQIALAMTQNSVLRSAIICNALLKYETNHVTEVLNQYA